MEDREQVIKHLEIIQGIVNRLAHDSFLVKGWSMTIIAVAVLFMSRTQDQGASIMLGFLFPVIGFWILDGYFLWQERLFRGVYDDVREKDATDFFMNITDQKNKPDAKWSDAILSKTLFIFYGIEIFFIVWIACRESAL